MASLSHPPSPIHFFKVILKTSLERIMIPKKFTWRYGGGMPNPVSLKPPDGKEWKVYWTKHDNGIWFEKGWKEFASFYSMDEGHWVMFKYEGTSQFDVHIFDQSALEIDYPSKDTSGRNDNLDKLSDDINEILNEMPPNQKARPITPLSSPLPHKRTRTATDEDVEKRSSNLQNLHMGVKTKDGQSQGTKFQKLTNAELKLCKQEPEEYKGGRIFTRSECLNSERKKRMKALTAAEKTQALKRADTFRSENPFFRVVMQPSHVKTHCCLRMPTEFAEKYMRIKCGVVQLEALDGRTWSANYNIPRIGSGGWGKFVMDNNLNVGDVCVFEMIDLSFKVHIFRDAEEGNLELNPSKEMQMSSMVHTALENAIFFKSKNPYFIINMTHSHIVDNSNLPVPTKFADTYLHTRSRTGRVKLLVEGGVWCVEYIRRSCGRQKMAEFSSGWKRFHEDNDLKVGDVCVFELVQRIKRTFQMTILRAPEHPVQSTDSGKKNNLL